MDRSIVDQQQTMEDRRGRCFAVRPGAAVDPQPALSDGLAHLLRLNGYMKLDDMTNHISEEISDKITILLERVLGVDRRGLEHPDAHAQPLEDRDRRQRRAGCCANVQHRVMIVWLPLFHSWRGRILPTEKLHSGVQLGIVNESHFIERDELIGRCSIKPSGSRGSRLLHMTKEDKQVRTAM